MAKLRARQCSRTGRRTRRCIPGISWSRVVVGARNSSKWAGCVTSAGPRAEPRWLPASFPPSLLWNTSLHPRCCDGWRAHPNGQATPSPVANRTSCPSDAAQRPRFPRGTAGCTEGRCQWMPMYAVERDCQGRSRPPAVEYLLTIWDGNSPAQLSQQVARNPMRGSAGIVRCNRSFSATR